MARTSKETSRWSTGFGPVSNGGLTPSAGELVRMTDTVTRMFVFTDRRDWDALRSLFASEVTIDWTSLAGGTPVTLSPADLVSGWRRTLSGFRATHHQIGNVLLEQFDRERAVVSCYGTATHLLASELGGSHWRVAGSYLFQLHLFDDNWRIAAATFTAVWGDGNQQLLELAAENTA